MLVYHFLNEEFGLNVLRDQRIKVSMLNDLNDPFELYSVNLSDRQQRIKFKILKEELSKNRRILCFSKKWNNPLLWSHYADKHKGIALEFGAFHGYINEVKYRKSRVKLDFDELMKMEDPKKFKLIIKLLTTKYYEWKYEEEYRAFVDKGDVFEINKIPFTTIINNTTFTLRSYVTLTGVVLGPLCKLNYKDIEKTLPKGVGVNVTKTRLAFHSFKVVKNNQHKTRYIVGGA